jgi:hypothetical protein
MISPIATMQVTIVPVLHSACRIRPSASGSDAAQCTRTKQYIIAAALLAGITVAAVARQLGVSRSWASREANAAGTRILIAELLYSHRERLSRLFDQMLDVIEDAFQARKIYFVRGVLVDAGPDHYARIEAAKLFIQLLSSRR